MSGLGGRFGEPGDLGGRLVVEVWRWRIGDRRREGGVFRDGHAAAMGAAFVVAAGWAPAGAAQDLGKRRGRCGGLVGGKAHVGPGAILCGRGRCHGPGRWRQPILVIVQVGLRRTDGRRRRDLRDVEVEKRIWACFAHRPCRRGRGGRCGCGHVVTNLDRVLERVEGVEAMPAADLAAPCVKLLRAQPEHRLAGGAAGDHHGPGRRPSRRIQPSWAAPTCSAM